MSFADRREGVRCRVERAEPVLFQLFHVNSASLRHPAGIGTGADPDP
jgi:hypothetical protein